MTGYFGKVSTRGDFVGQGLPPPFVQAWDDWLQRCLQASRVQLGGRWLPCYLTSPIWRFALAPDVLSDGVPEARGGPAWGGLMMPSVDRVGRHFPLMLAAPGPHPLGDWYLQHSAWYDQLEDLARASLEPGFEPERLATAPQPASHASVSARAALGSAEERQDTAFVDALEVQAEPAAAQSIAAYDMQDRVAALLPLAQGSMLHMARPLPGQQIRLPAAALAGHTLWWTEGSDDVAPSMLVCRGLPRPEGFAAMLDGAWSSCGWTCV